MKLFAILATCLLAVVFAVENPITMKEILGRQQQWRQAILDITAAYQAKEDFVKVAADAAAELYAYDFGPVLFKPTKAAENPFRPTAVGALSYFVGGSNVGKGGYSEDAGFAINGGKGWSKVTFENHDVDLNGDTAAAMGEYFFTCATTGEISKVQYTFGYKRTSDGKARIHVHHSSVPYSRY